MITPCKVTFSQQSFWRTTPDSVNYKKNAKRLWQGFIRFCYPGRSDINRPLVKSGWKSCMKIVVSLYYSYFFFQTNFGRGWAPKRRITSATEQIWKYFRLAEIILIPSFLVKEFGPLNIFLGKYILCSNILAAQGGYSHNFLRSFFRKESLYHESDLKYPT
jgi:hypothetical protein